MSHPGPCSDADSLEVLHHALGALAERRGLWLGTEAPVLHLLASLIATATEQLAVTVSTVRREGGDWHEVARLLGTTADDARQRFETAPVIGARRWATSTND